MAKSNPKKTEEQKVEEQKTDTLEDNKYIQMQKGDLVANVFNDPRCIKTAEKQGYHRI